MTDSPLIEEGEQELAQDGDETVINDLFDIELQFEDDAGDPEHEAPRGPRPERIPLIFNPRAKGNDYRGVKRFLVFASGARPEILAQCPNDEATYVGLGGTVVATSFLGGIAMFFSMYQAMQMDLFPSFLGGFIWSSIIFNLDRWLIVSQKRTASRRKQWLQVIPRVLVALLIGFVISEPLLHQMFKPKLDQEIKEIRSSGYDAFVQRINSGAEALKIEENEAKIAANATASSGDTALETRLTDEIKSLEAATKAAYDKFSGLDLEVTKEVEGLAPNGMTGCGPSCVVKSQSRDQARDEWASIRDTNSPRISDLQRQLDESRARSVGERQQRIAEVQADTESRIRENADLQESIKAQIEDYRSASDIGLLDYIDALGSLSSKNTSIFWARWLICALFILMDIIPVIGKTLMLTSDKRTYEKACDAIDERLSQDAELIVEEAQVDREQRLSLIQRQAESRADAQAENNEYFIRTAAETQREIGDILLSRWRAEQISRVSEEHLD